MNKMRSKLPNDQLAGQIDIASRGVILNWNFLKWKRGRSGDNLRIIVWIVDCTMTRARDFSSVWIKLDLASRMCTDRAVGYKSTVIQVDENERSISRVIERE